MNIKIKKLNQEAIIPTTGTSLSAGYDLYCVDEAIIEPQTSNLMHTGIAMEIPEGYFGAVFARSGLASKFGLRPANCVGVIDADYRGEIMVPLRNDSKETREIKKGERIAQLVIMPFLKVEFNEVNELDCTERNEKGFGSTGK